MWYTVVHHHCGTIVNGTPTIVTPYIDNGSSPLWYHWMDGLCFIKKNTASEALSTGVSGSSGNKISNY